MRQLEDPPPQAELIDRPIDKGRVEVRRAEPQHDWFEYEQLEDRNFLQRHRDLMIVAGVLVVSVGVFFGAKFLSKANQSPLRHEDVTMIVLPPPLPPPRPTPTPQQQPTPEPRPEEQKMLDQQPVQDEKKIEIPKDKPPDAPAPLGTSITGQGGGQDFGLSAGLGGGGGYGNGGGGGMGSKYGWYASQVQTRVVDAVRNNRDTGRSTMDVIVCIWPDSTGRVTKARVVGSTGNHSLDAALKNEVLTGLQLSDPPPSDMPLPIVIHLTSHLPGV